MRVACLCVLTLTALVSGRALPAQGSPPPNYALALKARYLPLESVRDGTLRMPKVLARKVTVRRDGALLQQVLLDIATQAGLGLSYGEEVARSRTVVSLDVTETSAAEALAAAVRETPWTVLVSASGQVTVVPSSQRQLGAVAGRITDRATAVGIAGAAVQLDGTRLSANSDDAGRFRIVGVPAGTYVLVVRRLGYARASASVDVAADQTTTADVALLPAASTLDQVVVTGVPGATTKRTLGNAITSLDAADITSKSSNSSITELLQAKAPGVTILPGGGTPGAGASIRVRGAGSMVAATAPVIYVDGVRLYTGAQGNFWNSWRSQRPNEPSTGAGQDAMALDMLKPEDIESIEVIKGPAASTLYGADAANGVIQIITKQGATNTQGVRWDVKLGVGQTAWAVDRPTNYTTCTAAAKSATFSDGSPRFPGCEGLPDNSILSTSSLDAAGALRNGDVRNYSMSGRGGGQAYSFFVSANRDMEQGVFSNSMNERTAARGNFALHPTPKVDLSVNLAYTKTHTAFPINDDGYGLIQAAMLYRPGYDVGGPLPFDGNNGPDRINQWDNQIRANRMTLGMTANYRPREWLTNRLTVGIDQNDRLADKYLPPGSIWGGAQGLAERATPTNQLFTVDYAGTVLRSLTSDVSSSSSFGLQYNSSQFRNTIARGSGFASGTIDQISLAALTTSGSEFIDQKSLGLYAQEQVGWRERLFITGALRVDNNSVFGDQVRSLYYPKLSAAWVLSDEPFVRDRLSSLNELKLRAAWGQAGNSPRPYSGQRNFTAGVTLDENGIAVPALRTGAYGNEEIKPERGSEIELGFDASMFQSRLGAEVTYYDKTTHDALMEIPIAASVGFIGTRYENLGTINNRGVELALSGTPVTGTRVVWDARLSLASMKNKLVSFGWQRDPIVLTLYQPVQRHEAGYPLGGYWGNFPERDASGALVRDGSGNLVASAQRYIGPSTPTREAFLSNTLTLFRDFRVFALLDYKGGHYLYNVKDQFRCFGQPFANPWNTNPALNIPGSCAEVNDPALSDEAKEIRQQDPSINNGIFIQKADFIKLRDVSMTYTMPEQWSRRMGTTRAAITVAAHNVAILWKPHYTGPDPEVNFTGIDDPGGQFSFIRVDSWTAPMTRRFTTAIELSF